MEALLLKPSFVMFDFELSGSQKVVFKIELLGFSSTVQLAQVQPEWTDSLTFVLDILS